MKSLSGLSAGAKCTIKDISATHEFTLKLNSMSIRIGRTVEVLRVSTEKGPMHIKVGPHEVILRLVDAACIHVVLDE